MTNEQKQAIASMRDAGVPLPKITLRMQSRKHRPYHNKVDIPFRPKHRHAFGDCL